MFGLVGVDWNYGVVLLGAVTLTEGLKSSAFSQKTSFLHSLRLDLLNRWKIALGNGGRLEKKHHFPVAIVEPQMQQPVVPSVQEMTQGPVLPWYEDCSVQLWSL